jgi:hypothetical protein
MSQRGGSVVTYVRFGDKVYSPVIDKGEADFIVSFELLEAARWTEYLKPGGKIVVNTQQINPMPVIIGAAEYPQGLAEQMKAAGLDVVTHIILGLPGETVEMMVETTESAVKAGTDGVKFHLLHVLKGTDLARDYEAGLFQCLSLEEYGAILKRCVDILPEHVVVHRITGDGAKKDLIAPLWSADKKRVLNYLHKVLEIQP